MFNQTFFNQTLYKKIFFNTKQFFYQKSFCNRKETYITKINVLLIKNSVKKPLPNY